MPDLRSDIRAIRIFIAPIYIFGAYLIFISGYRWYQTDRTNDWLPITAEISSIKVKNHGIEKSDRSINVTYHFLIEGKNYDGHLLTPAAANRFSKHKFENVYATFKSAKEIMVYYNPKNPSESTMVNQLVNAWYTRFFWALTYNSFLLAIYFYIRNGSRRWFLLPLLFFLSSVYCFRSGLIDNKLESSIQVVSVKD